MSIGFIFISDYLKVSKGFDENVAKYYFRQLIDGLEAIHKSGLAHRDIKLENLLLDADFQLKIADLEFAAEILNNKGERVKLREKLGSDKYMAPELHFIRERFYYGDKADIFSAGIVFLAFLSGTLFFEKTNCSDYKFRLFVENSEKFLQIYLKKKNPEISDDIIDLLVKMLNPDFEKRITISEIKSSAVYMSAGDNFIEKSEINAKMQKLATLIFN